MKVLLSLIILSATLSACDFSKSVKKDQGTGLMTAGDGLSCEDVYLSVNELRVSNTTFVYGTKFSMNFQDIRGFKKDGEFVFPGMRMLVTSAHGDTVFTTGDLYEEYSQGMSFSPLVLSATFTAATPAHSGGKYKILVNIWDKKGTGRFLGSVDFTIKPGDNIVTEASGVKLKEAYLFSADRNSVIPGNKIIAGEITYIIIEGLEGFAESEGFVFPAMSLTMTDQGNRMIIDEKDLFQQYGATGLKAEDLKARVSANFTLRGVELKNPLRLTMIISDNKGTAKLKITSELNAE